MILIFSGGIYDYEFCRFFLTNKQFDGIICTDSGLDACDKLGMVPDVIVGDFDSVDKNVLKKYEETGLEDGKEQCAEKTVEKVNKEGISKTIKIYTYPSEKDETDLELAILKMKECFDDTEAVILGATGARIDHFLSNIDILYFALQNGITASIADPYSMVSVRDTDFVAEKDDYYNKYFSLIPFSKEVTGLTLKGFKYEVTDFTLVKGKSRGNSNEIVSDNATVSFKEGELIVIYSIG